MKNKARQILFITVTVFFFCSCKKEMPPMLPPITDTGANTFGCLVDGKVWLPGADPFGFIRPKEWYYSSQYFYMHFSNTKGDADDYLNLIFYPVSHDTTIIIKNTPDTTYPHPHPEFLFDRYYNKGSFYDHFAPVNQYSGQMTFTKFDTVNYIFSGTFWFDAVDTVTGKVVHVTEGRFDLGTL
ncbi:MAG: hypothetical protein WCJ33_08895 [Pseudomonadota bacterium]